MKAWQAQEAWGTSLSFGRGWAAPATPTQRYPTASAGAVIISPSPRRQPTRAVISICGAMWVSAPRLACRKLLRRSPSKATPEKVPQFSCCASCLDSDSQPPELPWLPSRESLLDTTKILISFQNLR